MDSRISQERFRQAADELRSAQGAYGGVWSIRSCEYPFVLLDIMSGSSAPCLVLALNMRNWDFWPPEAAYRSLDLRRPLAKKEIPAATEGSVSHIQDGRNGAWPCSPGFLQYHRMYHEDSWQLLRGSCTITWIVERACDMVDRRRLREPIV